VEIKARVENLVAVTARARVLADRGPTRLVQDDVYFAVPEGRFKVRRLSSSEGVRIPTISATWSEGIPAVVPI
jgi:adenylate cyclase class IV